MSWVATAIVASTAVNVTMQKKAAKKARKQAKEDEAAARKAEVFAETEGSGLGELGEVRLGLDDEVDTRVKRKTKRASLSI